MRIWINPTDVGRHHESNVDKREQICRDIDNNGFDWQIWAVAASGFLTDSYNLFATNVVLPSLAFVYWSNDTATNTESAINTVTLVGSCLGQLTFGYLADRYGRRKMYGFELFIVIFCTLGLCQSSSGYNGSMSITSWIMFWRFFIGFGIGAEYPLSAVITAEFAARQSRGRMMASVFIMQPIGQLMASLVGLAVLMTLGRQAGLETMTDAKEAATVVDRIWRWVVGAGAIPAIIAIGFRLTIPESPRYTLDVDHDGVRALRDTARYCTTAATQRPTSQHMDKRRVPHMEYSAVDGMQPLPQAHYEETNDNDSDSMEIMDVGDPAQERTQNATASNYNDDYNSEDEDNNPDPFSCQELKQFFWTEGNIKPLLGTSITWFLLDFAFYGLGINNPRTIADIWSSEPHVAKSSETPAWGNPADHGLGIYETLKQDGIRSIITVSVGSLLGSIILIKAINYIPRKAWLLWSFVGMGVLFAVIGGSFFKVAHTDLHALTITLYVLCQLLFNLGPNTLTFIIPAEIFPTRYRATCHGISAFGGKLGSVIVQAFLPSLHLQKPNSMTLGWLLISFSPVMLLGALFTWAWIPEVQNPRGSEMDVDEKGRKRSKRWEVPNKSLEELAGGMAALQEEKRVGFRRRGKALLRGDRPAKGREDAGFV